LRSQPTANVTVPLASDDTTEGTVSPASLVFTPMDWASAQLVTVTGIDDTVADGDVAYGVTVGDAVSADLVYDGKFAQVVPFTNADDAPAGITVGLGATTTTEAGGTATFPVTLRSQPTANVTFFLSSSDTTEGTVTPAALTFTAADWNFPQTVTVVGA